MFENEFPEIQTTDENSEIHATDEKTEKKNAQKKEKTNKAMKKLLAAITELGNIGTKFDFTAEEQSKVFERIDKSVEHMKVKFARDDEFSL